MDHIRFQVSNIFMTGPDSATVVMRQISPIEPDDRDANGGLTYYGVPIKDVPYLGQIYRFAPVRDESDATS